MAIDGEEIAIITSIITREVMAAIIAMEEVIITITSRITI